LHVTLQPATCSRADAGYIIHFLSNWVITERWKPLNQIKNPNNTVRWIWV